MSGEPTTAAGNTKYGMCGYQGKTLAKDVNLDARRSMLTRQQSITVSDKKIRFKTRNPLVMVFQSGHCPGKARRRRTVPEMCFVSKPVACSRLTLRPNRPGQALWLLSPVERRPYKPSWKYNRATRGTRYSAVASCSSKYTRYAFRLRCGHRRLKYDQGGQNI